MTNGTPLVRGAAPGLVVNAGALTLGIGWNGFCPLATMAALVGLVWFSRIWGACGTGLRKLGPTPPTPRADRFAAGGATGAVGGAVTPAGRGLRYSSKIMACLGGVPGILVTAHQMGKPYRGVMIPWPQGVPPLM